MQPWATWICLRVSTPIVTSGSGGGGGPSYDRSFPGWLDVDGRTWRAPTPRRGRCRLGPACPSTGGPHGECGPCLAKPVSSSTHVCGAIRSQAQRESIFRTGTTSHGAVVTNCSEVHQNQGRFTSTTKWHSSAADVACRPESVDLARYDGGRAASRVPRAG
jgi:hypothetical protein